MAGAVKKRGLGRGLGALISTKPVSVNPAAAAVSEVMKEPEESKKEAAPVVKIASERMSEKPGTIAPKTKDVSIVEASENNENESVDGLVRYVSITDVSPNPDQPRKFFEEQEVEELVSSIQNYGLLQPILVRKTSSSSDLQIVAGERRWRAANRAMLAQVPVIIKEIDDQECLEISLVENVQRSNLTPMEEALGYQELQERFQLTQAQVAEKVGKDRATVSNLIRLLKLPQEVQAKIESGDISVGHAKAILTVKEPKLQIALAAKVVSEGMSVRDLEKIVARKVSLANKRKAPGGKAVVPTKYRDLVEQLQRTLGSKVTIHESTKGKGKLVVDYFSFEEFERLADQICYKNQ